MMTMLPAFVPFAPILTAILLIVTYSSKSAKKHELGWWVMFSGLLVSLWTLFLAIQNPEANYLSVAPFFQLNVDRLASIMMVVISGFGTLLFRYSIRYMQNDPGRSRYLILMAITVASLLLMVSSTNLLTLFIFWQVLSWMLAFMTHNYAHIPTINSSFRTFIIQRIGDLTFLAGIVLAYHLYGTIEFKALFEQAATNKTTFSLFNDLFNISGATAVTLLIFVGAMTKSAQFPFHMWLADSLYAPTPTTALLHAGLINAGGFLLNRLAPLYSLSPATLHVVLIIGLITTLMGKCMMLVQNDIKKTLGFSTMGQMGYMIIECGLGAFPVAIFHLIAHGFYKADSFLGAGNGIHKARLHPAKPSESSPDVKPNIMEFVTGFVVSLIIPFVMMVAVHYFLDIPFLDFQSVVILLLFSWVTASQTMFTLFRLNKGLTTKAALMPWLGIIATIYFFMVETFSHFLIPDPIVTNHYFKAAELPPSAYWLLTAILVISVSVDWFFSVGRHQTEDRLSWFGDLKHTAYLFFLNRLYLDGAAIKAFNSLKNIGSKIERSKATFFVVLAVCVLLVARQPIHWSQLPLENLGLLILAALLVPLFPFHGFYSTALTQTPNSLKTLLSIALPIAGLTILQKEITAAHQELMPIIGILAVFGALWGSTKALLQSNVYGIASYAGLALYSLMWWHISQVGELTTQTWLFVWSVTLTLSGIVFGWTRISARYGNLESQRVTGLFQPMPVFSLCFALLIMAAVGLAPFSLFFGYLGLLFHPATSISFGHVIILLTWFVACWYLFKLMQKLLFGPYRKDLAYKDLNLLEVSVFIVILALLILPGSITENWIHKLTPQTTAQLKGAS